MIGKRYRYPAGPFEGRAFTVRAPKPGQMGTMRMYIDHPDDDGQSDCGPVDAAFLARCEPLGEETPDPCGGSEGGCRLYGCTHRGWEDRRDW